MRCSSDRMRRDNVSSVSAGSTGTAAWSTMGPVSVPSSTKCTVAPATLTPCSRAWRWACKPGKAGSSEGWMLSSRPSKCQTNTAPRTRMNPARHTSPPPRSSRAAITAFSWASRLGYCLGSTNNASTPRPRAISRAPAVARSVTSAATTAGTRPASTASTSASKFEPRPEARTPIRSVSDIDDRPGAGPDLADLEHALPRRRQGLARARRILGAHHQEIAQAHVEGAPHLGVLDPARLLDDPEYGRHGPRARIDHSLAALGQDARQV